MPLTSFPGAVDTFVAPSSAGGDQLNTSGKEHDALHNKQSDALVALETALFLTEIEIDFGSTPIQSKNFTITDARVSGTTKIVAWQSGNTATGRNVDDASWDPIVYAARAGTGTFTLNAVAPLGKVVGKRKLYYQIQVP